MKAISTKNALALVLSASVLAGCTSTSTIDEDASGAVTAVDQQGGGEVYPGGEGSTLTSAELAEQQAQLEREAKEKEEAVLREIRTFYFDFDKSAIRPESRAALMAHAAFLSANPNLKVNLEGHSDERGTKEYNLALGERRAQSVERFLVVNGVARTQVEVVSYGEEKPAAMGHDESAWAKNRRVYIEYK